MNSRKALAALTLGAAVFQWAQADAAAVPGSAAADAAATLVASNAPARGSPESGLEQQHSRAAAAKAGAGSAAVQAPSSRLAWPAFSLPAPEESQDWLLLVCAIAVIAFIAHRKSGLL